MHSTQFFFFLQTFKKIPLFTGGTIRYFSLPLLFQELQLSKNVLFFYLQPFQNKRFNLFLARYGSIRPDITPLANKYYAAGKSLEAECDAQFYSLLAAFEGELKANSFPLDAAAKAKATYEARKSARAGQLFPASPDAPRIGRRRKNGPLRLLKKPGPY